MGRPFLMLPARSLSVRAVPHPHVERARSRFYQQIHQPITTTFLEHLALCQVWTGAKKNGRGIFTINRQTMPIQEFAYELYFSSIPPCDPAESYGLPTKMVARCVAAGTPNCVHQNHLGLVRAGSLACPPLPPEQRQLVRLRFHTDGVDLEAPDRGKLATARIARIVLRFEGLEDPVMPCEQPVDKDR